MTDHPDGQEHSSTLRLLMPQWQGGGDNLAYYLGSTTDWPFDCKRTSPRWLISLVLESLSMRSVNVMLLSDMLRRLPIVSA